MFSLLSMSLAESGQHVLLPDLSGTGDSSGGFEEASWSCWLEDCEASLAFLKSRGIKTINVLGLRTGALLVAELITANQNQIARCVLWQPVVDGSVFLTQFLRLLIASNMMSGDENKLSTKDLMNDFQKNRSVEIAGYTVSPQLVEGLVSSKLKNSDTSKFPKTAWFDLVPSADRVAPVVNTRLQQQWSAEGVDLISKTVVGDSFWNTVEIVENPQLIQETIEFLSLH